MTLYHRLEAAITTAEVPRSRLLEAVLHDAVTPVTEALQAAE